jgi:hypothetical protein
MQLQVLIINLLNLNILITEVCFNFQTYHPFTAIFDFRSCFGRGINWLLARHNYNVNMSPAHQNIVIPYILRWGFGFLKYFLFINILK